MVSLVSVSCGVDKNSNHRYYDDQIRAVSKTIAGLIDPLRMQLQPQRYSLSLLSSTTSDDVVRNDDDVDTFGGNSSSSGFDKHDIQRKRSNDDEKQRRQQKKFPLVGSPSKMFFVSSSSCGRSNTSTSSPRMSRKHHDVVKATSTNRQENLGPATTTATIIDVYNRNNPYTTLKPSMMQTYFLDALLGEIKFIDDDYYNDDSYCNDTIGFVSPTTQLGIMSHMNSDDPVRTGKKIIVQETNVLRGRDVLRSIHSYPPNGNHNNNNNNHMVIGSICLVIRRPGCAFCRQQALMLSLFCMMYPEIVIGYSLWGIVKETGIDDNGLTEFSQKYFFYDENNTRASVVSSYHSTEQLIKLNNTPTSDTENKTRRRYCYPLYCDKLYTFYHALGDRKISLQSLLFHPMYIKGIFCEIYSQWKDGTQQHKQLQQQQQIESKQPTKENMKSKSENNVHKNRSNGLVNDSSNSSNSSNDDDVNDAKDDVIDQKSSLHFSEEKDQSNSSFRRNRGNNDKSVSRRVRRIGNVNSAGTSTNNVNGNNNSGIFVSKGEGITQGGIIIFDAETNLPIFAYEEETRYDIPLYELASFLIYYREQKMAANVKKMTEQGNEVDVEA